MSRSKFVFHPDTRQSPIAAQRPGTAACASAALPLRWSLSCGAAVHPGAALLLLLACLLALATLLAAPMPFAAGSHDAVSLVAILVYHRFSDADDDATAVRVATFHAHLRLLRERGYEIVPLRRIVAWLREPRAPLPPKAVALTVDDAQQSVYEQLLPIAQREQLPVTLFVYPSAISKASCALTWEQLRAMRATNLFDVQSHTGWHPNFAVERSRQSAASFERFATARLQDSREQIEAELGSRADMLAWFCSVCDVDVRRSAGELGYVAGFTLSARRVEKSSTLLALPRFPMVDDVTPRILGRLLGEPDTPSVHAPRAPS
jgi:peptidoglycan/xylan/chitin deacetylase (PgdA/CDA1 family)